MKKLLLIASLVFISLQASSQKSIYYYGVNGELIRKKADACVMKTVRKGMGNRYKVMMYARLNNDDWLLLNSKNIKFKSGREQIIRTEGVTLIPGIRTRKVERTVEGIYIIRDYAEDILFREAHCSKLIPVHYEGMVTEYYSNGNTKSESIYRDNMLQSNKNWNPDGTPYINNIFYSTHTGPTYAGGNEGIIKFISDHISGSALPSHIIQDEIIVGAVVMETGTLDGVKIVYSSRPEIDEYLMNAVKELPGEWGPATLDGEKVRYFIQLPFYLKNNRVRLQNFDITKDGRMILVDE